MPDDSPIDPLATGNSVSWREAFFTWCRVAGLSFGGPAGQIAVMHRIIVDEKKWISEERFLHALNYCMLLPGPEAQQLATYIGWLMHGARGGLMSGLLFILPGVISILALSILYTSFADTHFVQALFFGLKPAVMAIVLEAVLRIGKRVLKNRTMIALAATSFLAIFIWQVPFPLLILLAGVIGFIGGRVAPAQFHVIKGHGSTAATPNDAATASAPLTWRRPLVVSAICLSLWFLPILGLRLSLGPESVFYQEATFFSQAAVVTFGGAYSVLAYIAQQAVERYHWLQPGEMLDGLGLAESTPGPLIMVVQFVGFLGAYRHPGPFSPLAAGIIGSLVTTWVTFVPCFYWIFLGAPYIERLRNHRGLSSALSAITAAVVGVVLNLAIWFSLHTLFAQVHTWSYGPARLIWPELSSLRVGTAAIAAIAVGLTFVAKQGLAVTLSTAVILGLLVYTFVPAA